MDQRVPGQDLFPVIVLKGELTLKRLVTDEAIARIDSALLFVKIRRNGKHTIRLQMAIAVHGGVTEAWLAQALQSWIASWRACEQKLRCGLTSTTRRRTLTLPMSIQ